MLAFAPLDLSVPSRSPDVTYTRQLIPKGRIGGVLKPFFEASSTNTLNHTHFLCFRIQTPQLLELDYSPTPRSSPTNSKIQNSLCKSGSLSLPMSLQLYVICGRIIVLDYSYVEVVCFSENS